MTPEQINNEYHAAIDYQFKLMDNLEVAIASRANSVIIFDLKAAIEESKKWCVAIDSQRHKFEK